MRSVLLFFALAILANSTFAQYVYTIKADSVKITNCDSSELILENHTQAVPGFLYNTGNGRTIFKRGAQKLNDSTYLVGADTIKLHSNAWVQGGNAFGTTGVLGTLDNHHLDFYTNGLERVRLDSAGNLLVRTTTDNGNPLQVNGAGSFSGNVNIGSATITNTGSLIGTDAILFNHIIAEYHSYPGNDVFVSKVDNVLYDYQNRFNTTTTTGSDGTMNIDIVIPPNELTGPGITYPGGYMAFSFWNNGIPQSVSVTLHDSLNSTWYGPFSTSTNTNVAVNPAGYFEIPVGGSANYVNEIKIIITPTPGGSINLQNIEYVLGLDNEGLANAYPYVGKTNNEHLYNFIYFKYAGVDNVRLSPLPTYPNYFLNSVLVGSSTDNGGGNILQVTGNMTATGAIGIGTSTPAAQLHTTGSVRFAGLTSDSTQTRVLVSDASGNLFYRTASSLATNDLLRSSLAVNGTISAKQLILRPKDWPDYVFDSAYRLPSLPAIESYILKQHHLPGIPSAQEVGNNGTDVGDNQAALLKKVEELTLYIIEQNKKTEQQNKEIESLRQEMRELKELITRKTPN